MSARSIVHNDTVIFDGTNYALWRNCLLCNLRTLCSNIEQFLDVGFSPSMDPQNLSLEDEKNLHLEAQVSNELIFSLSPTVNLFLTIVKRKSSHEKWTKLKKYLVVPFLILSVVYSRRSLFLHIMKSSKLLPPPAAMSSHLHPL